MRKRLEQRWPEFFCKHQKAKHQHRREDWGMQYRIYKLQENWQIGMHVWFGRVEQLIFPKMLWNSRKQME
jgi:hypothetical protein